MVLRFNLKLWHWSEKQEDEAGNRPGDSGNARGASLDIEDLIFCLLLLFLIVFTCQGYYQLQSIMYAIRELKSEENK